MSSGRTLSSMLSLRRRASDLGCLDLLREKVIVCLAGTTGLCSGADIRLCFTRIESPVLIQQHSWRSASGHGLPLLPLWDHDNEVP